MKRCVASIVAVCVGATSAQAYYLSRVVVAGGTLELGFFSSVDPDCSTHGYATVRVNNQPQHGAIATKKGRGVLFALPNHLLHDCNARKADGVHAYYRPEAGFTGSDNFTIDVIYPAGIERIIDYQVTVK